MNYTVFYCQYETGKSVTSDDGLVLDLAVVCDQLLPELSPGDFLGVVDADGTTVQTAVEKDHWWVEIPAPDEAGSYGKKLPTREAAIAFFRHLPETFDPADFDGLEFQAWQHIELRDRAGRMWTGLIASPDRLWFIDARALMRRLLGLEPGWCGDNTAVLLFNMIRDGARLPAARPGDYLELG